MAQIGCGKDGYFIEGPSETWEDYLGDDLKNAQMVKTCIYNRVRLLFDPPLNSSVTEIMKANLAEMEWRLKVQLENKEDDNG